RRCSGHCIFFQAEDGIRDFHVTGVQTCALPIYQEIKLITESSIPTICEVRSGGIQLMKPLLLHASAKTTNNKNRRVIHLEFNSVNLPGGLKWGEKLELNI